MTLGLYAHGTERCDGPRNISIVVRFYTGNRRPGIMENTYLIWKSVHSVVSSASMLKV